MGQTPGGSTQHSPVGSVSEITCSLESTTGHERLLDRTKTDRTTAPD